MGWGGESQMQGWEQSGATGRQQGWELCRKRGYAWLGVYGRDPGCQAAEQAESPVPCSHAVAS